MCNIGRKWHLTQLIQDFFKDSLIGELDQPVALLYHVYYGSRQDSVSEGNNRAPTFIFFPGFTRVSQMLSVPSFQEKHLNGCAGVRLFRQEVGPE